LNLAIVPGEEKEGGKKLCEEGCRRGEAAIEAHMAASICWPIWEKREKGKKERGEESP